MKPSHQGTKKPIDYHEFHDHERNQRPSCLCLLSFRKLLASLCLPLALICFLYYYLHCNPLPDWAFKLSLQRCSWPYYSINSAPTPGLLSNTSALEVFQVYQPVNLHEAGRENKSCTVLLMDHSFGFSYGKPFIGKLSPLHPSSSLTSFLGNYTPPSCKFNRVVMNFTVTSRGRQFDRLALMYFGDTEVWRTSTAEPTPRGIEWTYLKDMTHYLYLWNQPQKIIFDLGNLVDDTYTGLFNTTLTATFLTIDETPDAADLIVPISGRRSTSNSASVFSLPAETAINTVTLPRNANRAIFTISACGQAEEEFWWSNVLDSAADTFQDTTGSLPSFSPWRELQVYIDGQLAGVQWPSPVIFTGGVVPGLWRPIVGIDAFDLREYEIDISPWLGLLSDGEPHTFEIKVVGLADDGNITYKTPEAGEGIAGRGRNTRITETVGHSWLVTGKIFLWLDEPGSVTTSTQMKFRDSHDIAVSLFTTQDAAGANATLLCETEATRWLARHTTLTTASGTRTSLWRQQLRYLNQNYLYKYGLLQLTHIASTANDTMGVWAPDLNDPDRQPASYVLVVHSEYHAGPDAGDLAINASIWSYVKRWTGGESVFPSGLEGAGKGEEGGRREGLVDTRQQGKATYRARDGKSWGSGATEQVFAFDEVCGPERGAVYARDVGARNGEVVWDREGPAGMGGPVALGGDKEVEMGEGHVRSPREALGRGPGRVRRVLVQSGEGVVDGLGEKYIID